LRWSWYACFLIFLNFLGASAQTTFASVLFFDDSITKADQCAIVTLAEVSAELLKDDTVSLSSAFAKFKKTTAYAVKNSKNAVVGNLIGDGVEITFDNSVSSAKVCFTLRQTVLDAADTSRYPALDIGYSTADLEKVEPLGVKVTKVNFPAIFLSKEQSGELYCSVLNNLENKRSYFPITRFADYQDTKHEIYDSEVYGN
jgi:hypothetical protein